MSNRPVVHHLDILSQKQKSEGKPAFSRSTVVVNRKLQLLLVFCIVTVICSAVSHIAVRWLHIRSSWGLYQHYGTQTLPTHAVLHGSSLAYDGVDWSLVADRLGEGIESWATAGSSPAEWEVLQRRSAKATRTFVVVSPYDLNEYWLSDFRADIVPLSSTITDLTKSDLDWQQCKRILSQYPRMFMRKLFPTIGRSDGVMVGLRTRLRKLVGGSAVVDAGEGPKFGSASKSEVKERITDWSEARLQRRLVLLRGTCQGKHSFNGPKKLALLRLLEQAGNQGQAILVVMPVSPIYHREFLTPAVNRDFEAALTDVQQHCPAAKLIRIDQVQALENNDYFSDTVHLNMYGQEIATQSLVSQLITLAAGR